MPSPVPNWQRFKNKYHSVPFTPLQILIHCPFLWPLDMPGSFLFPGLCTCCFLCLEGPSPATFPFGMFSVCESHSNASFWRRFSLATLNRAVEKVYLPTRFFPLYIHPNMNFSCLSPVFLTSTFQGRDPCQTLPVSFLGPSL